MTSRQAPQNGDTTPEEGANIDTPDTDTPDLDVQDTETQDADAQDQPTRRARRTLRRAPKTKKSTTPTTGDQGTPTDQAQESPEDRVRRLASDRLEKDETSKRTRRQREAQAKKDAKANKPKSAADLRRERDKRKRALNAGVRYGGSRWKYYAALAGILALAVPGILALIIANSKPSTAEMQDEVAVALREGGRDFPRGEAVMWAGQITRIWGTWDEANADGYEQAIAPYLSGGMDTRAGWNGKGKQDVTYATINPEPVVHDANHATVSAVYQTGTGNWRCLDIPVYAYRPEEFSANAKWAFTLASNPTPVPCNPRTGIAPSSKVEDVIDTQGLEANQEDGRTLSSTFFPAFFAAWAASDQTALKQFTTPGVQTVGLGGAMASLPQPSIGEAVVYVDKEGGAVDGKTYQSIVPVTWTVSGTTSQVSATYIVPVVKTGDRWAVAGEPMAAPQSPEVSGRGVTSIPAPGEGLVRPSYPAPSGSASGTPSPSPSASGSPSASPSPSPSASGSAAASSGASATASASPTASAEGEGSEEG